MTLPYPYNNLPNFQNGTYSLSEIRIAIAVAEILKVAFPNAGSGSSSVVGIIAIDQSNPGESNAVQVNSLPPDAAKEDGNLAAILNKIPTLGQASAANSIPAVLPAAQITALTPPTSVGVNNLSGLALDSSLQTIESALSSNLQQLLSAIKSQIQISDSIWTDNSGAYYVRQDSVNEGTGAITVNFVNPATGASVTPGSGLKPLSSANLIASTDYFTATASGTGYNSGDLLARIIATNSVITPASATTVWLNLTQSNTAIAAPAYSSIELSPQIVQAAQSGTWITQLSGGNINNITGSIPLPTGAAQDGTDATGVTAPAGGAGIRGWLSGLYNSVATLLQPCSTYISTALSSTPLQIKPNAGSLYGWNLVNPNTTPVWVNFYDSASVPTVGTATPITTIMVPAGNASAPAINMATPEITPWRSATNGLYMACVMGAAYTGSLNTAPTIGIYAEVKYR